MGYLLNRSVLLLNQSYQPLMIIGAKRAVVLVLSNKVEAIENHSEFVKSVYFKLPLPSVVRLFKYANFKKKEIILSRKNIFKRDNYQCQYCGFNSKELTIDHVIPRHKGGPDTWENLVAACLKCNILKGHKSINEAKLKLLSVPRKPNLINYLQKDLKGYQYNWRPYLYMEKN